MTEEKFTIDDADDDGKIKREGGSTMASVAKRESPKLWSAFEKVCEERGVKPGHVLGGKALRALEDADYAKQLARKQIDLSIIDRSSMRVEDVEYVMNLAEQLGLNDQQEDPIMDLVRERVESAGKTPLSEFTEGPERSQEVDRRLAKQLEQMDRRLSKIEKEAIQSGGGGSEGSDRKDLDDIFDSEEEETPDVEVDEGRVEEVEDDSMEDHEDMISVDVSEGSANDIISSDQGVTEE